VLELPHPPATFDFALSIAVIHHLSTRERRVAAIGSILEILKPRTTVERSKDCGGKALLYVWALEQASSRRGWDKGDAQDVMVPWVMKSRQTAQINGQMGMDETDPKEKTYQRYYHLYRKGELEEDVLHAGGVVLDSGYEKDNWWAIVGRK
jgi:tRNA (uracil-5-)-methyltransferase TRM9